MDSYRTFHLMTYTNFLSEDEIKLYIDKYRSIQNYAYILHDKDIYTKEDEFENNDHKEGTVKRAHWHIVLKLKSNAMPTNTIAKWFNIPDYCVKGIKGKGAFFNEIEYMLHKTSNSQAEGKHVYDDNEIKSDYKNWQAVINKRKPLEQTKALFSREHYRVQVMLHGLKIQEIKRTDPVAYAKDLHTLNALRKEYVLYDMEMPKLRINYFVSGESGSGKNVISKAIARTLFPDIENDDDIFFTVGKNNVSFDCYDGQPVIIWNDVRSFELSQELKSQGAIYSVFDTHPENCAVGIKYGKIRLCNQVNIINNPQTYRDFVYDLAKGEDVMQAYRRFPFVISMKERGTNVFNLYMNKGFFFNETEGKEYFSKENIFFDLKKDSMLHDFDLKKCREYENANLSIIKEGYDLMVSNHSLSQNIISTSIFTDQFDLQLL